MPYSLKSKYKVGESLLYESTNYVVLDIAQPRQRLVGKTVTQQLVSVLDEQTDGWIMHSQQRLLETEGQLGSPPDASFPPLRYRVDRYGNGYRLDKKKPFSKASTPREEVDLGDSWIHEEESEQPGAPPAQTKFAVEAIEQEGDDEVLTFVGQSNSASTEGSEGPSRTIIASRVAFSVTRGCTVRSKVVTSTTWSSGRKLETVAEMVLKDRGKQLHKG
jgi:hypothetical protein